VRGGAFARNIQDFKALLIAKYLQRNSWPTVNEIGTLRRVQGSYTTESTPARRLQLPREAVEATPIPAPTSWRWWGLDWSRHFPWMNDGIETTVGTIDDALPFIIEHYPALFACSEGDQRFLVEPMSATKLRIYREADIFLMKDQGRVIGILMGHPTDATTYYIRTGAVLQEYQGRHLTPHLVEYLAKQLMAVGVERLESDIVVDNRKSLIAHLRTGFVLVGTHLSERHGALTRVALHLDTEARRHFKSQFCPGDS
jgi:hypothetical protein